MPNIKPLNDRVLLERIEASDKTAGGILLPDSAKEKPTEGRVIATGEGRRSDKGERVPLTVQVGDRVLFSSYAGTAVKDGGNEYLILDESEILAVVDDKPFPGARKSAAKKAAPAKKSSPAKNTKKKAGK
jgi:chaperonin GroES